MNTAIEKPTVSDILVLARRMSEVEKKKLAKLLQRSDELPLPEKATMDEAIEFLLADVCSLGKAAELAGVTRWDIQVRLREQGISLMFIGDESAEEIDMLAQRLEQEGIL
jgi:predicted HTH domain antitoxin